MAVKTRTAKKTAVKSTVKPKVSDEDKAAKSAAAAEKVAAREALHTEQTEQVVTRYVNGDEKLSAVAQSLKITPGKAASLVMQHRVAEGEVPKITGATDETLLKAISVARLKVDEFSSWGWLAARSGKSELFIKTGLEAAGLYTPKAENIATKRSEAKPKTEPKAKATAKASGKKRVSGNAS